MKIDYTSLAWAQVAEYLTSELARLRAANDAVGLSEAQTNALRGEIRLCKKLLALPDEANRVIEAVPD